jgi:hypothetical protein
MAVLHSSWGQCLLLVLAAGRIILDLANIDLGRLPLTARLGERGPAVHRWGLVFCWGYLLLFLPGYLFGH